MNLAKFRHCQHKIPTNVSVVKKRFSGEKQYRSSLYEKSRDKQTTFATIKIQESKEQPKSESERIRIFAQILGKKRCQVATVLDNSLESALVELGEFRYRGGDFHGAVQAWNETLTLQRNRLGNRHPTVGTTLNLIGVALAQMDESMSYMALTAFEESLSIKQDNPGPGYEETADAVHNMWILFHNARERQKGQDGGNQLHNYRCISTLIKSERVGWQ